MPHNASGFGAPEEWLKRAKSNLAIANRPTTDDIFWEDLCFEAQQAAEKSDIGVVPKKGPNNVATSNHGGGPGGKADDRGEVLERTSAT